MYVNSLNYSKTTIRQNRLLGPCNFSVLTGFKKMKFEKNHQRNFPYYQGFCFTEVLFYRDFTVILFKFNDFYILQNKNTYQHLLFINQVIESPQRSLYGQPWRRKNQSTRACKGE